MLWWLISSYYYFIFNSQLFFFNYRCQLYHLRRNEWSVHYFLRNFKDFWKKKKFDYIMIIDLKAFLLRTWRTYHQAFESTHLKNVKSCWVSLSYALTLFFSQWNILYYHISVQSIYHYKIYVIILFISV